MIVKGAMYIDALCWMKSDIPYMQCMDDGGKMHQLGDSRLVDMTEFL